MPIVVDMVAVMPGLPVSISVAEIYPQVHRHWRRIRVIVIRIRVIGVRRIVRCRTQIDTESDCGGGRMRMEQTKRKNCDQHKCRDSEFLQHSSTLLEGRSLLPS